MNVPAQPSDAPRLPWFDRIAASAVDRRGPVVLLLSLITLVAYLGYHNPKFFSELFSESQPESLVSASDEAEPAARLPDVEPFSLSRSSAVIVVESDNFFTPQAARAMRQVVDDLEALSQVERIVWMDRVPVLNIFGLPEPLFPRSESSPARFAAAKEKALAHPLVGGQLLSLDARTLLLLVTLDQYFVMDDHDATGLLRETAKTTADQFPGTELRFSITGRIPAAIAAIEAHESNQVKYQLIGYGMIICMAIILFRGIRAVLILALAPAIGVFWTLGIVRFFQYTDNPLIDVILPILVSLVGLTDGVHLMVQMRKLRAGGLSEKEAARAGSRQVGMACLLTSLTTAIGFGSLILADSDWVRQFGICSVVGVLLTFVAVLTVIPLICSSRFGRKIHVGHERSLIDRNLGRISIIIEAALARRGLVSSLSIASTILLIGISFTLRPDQRQTDGLPESAEATRALRHVDQAFGGLEFAHVEVWWADDVDSSSPEILAAITAVDKLLTSEPLIGHPLSIRNLIDAQPGSGTPAERMSLLDLLPPPLKRAFFTPEHRTARVTFRVQDLGIAAYGPVFERIEKQLARLEEQHSAFGFELRGNAVWRWRHLYQIVVDLAASLGTASVIILIVLAVVYRSARIGLISIVPNIFPLALTGAFLALVGYNLEIVMVCSFTVCLGIAVDDTIHFLTRFQKERAACSDDEQAIRQAFTGVGTALLMTTTVLVVGFCTVITSDSRDHRIFATMGALTIGAALFADLVFLPALLAKFIPPTGRRTRPPTSAKTEHR